MNRSCTRRPVATRKLNKFTNTTSDCLLCPNCCKKQEAGESPETSDFFKDYIKSINYINSCHSFINRIIADKKIKTDVIMPDLPNFINIISHLGKANDYLHELDNIQSLDDLCSQTNDGEEQESGVFTVSDKKPTRNSSIPRPVTVSAEKTKSKCADEVSTLSSQTKTSKASITKHSKTVLDKGSRKKSSEEFRKPLEEKHHRSSEKLKSEKKSRKKEEIDILQQEVEIITCDLLTSASDSPNSSPRTPSSHSRSRSPKLRKKSHTKITYKTKSEHSMKIAPKSKSKKSQPKAQVNKQSKQKSESKHELEEEKHSSPSVTPRKRNQTATGKRKTKSQPILRKAEQVEKESCSPPEDSDIEPDDQENLETTRIFKQRTPRSVPVEPKYVVKQKPNDFFMKRRKPSVQDLRSESEIDLDPDESESDIDDDAFENQSIEEQTVKKTVKVSSSRLLTNTVLSNIGILTQSGKMKPEKEIELEKLLSTRAQDKQNSSFRQPRSRENVYDDDIVQINVSRMRNSSSDIRSDVEEREIETHEYSSVPLNRAYRRQY